jgi:hypothetical protein
MTKTTMWNVFLMRGTPTALILTIISVESKDLRMMNMIRKHLCKNRNPKIWLIMRQEIQSLPTWTNQSQWVLSTNQWVLSTNQWVLSTKVPSWIHLRYQSYLSKHLHHSTYQHHLFKWIHLRTYMNLSNCQLSWNHQLYYKIQATHTIYSMI